MGHEVIEAWDEVIKAWSIEKLAIVILAGLFSGIFAACRYWISFAGFGDFRQRNDVKSHGCLARCFYGVGYGGVSAVAFSGCACLLVETLSGWQVVGLCIILSGIVDPTTAHGMLRLFSSLRGVILRALKEIPENAENADAQKPPRSSDSQ